MSKAAANAYQDAKDGLDFLEGEVHRLEAEVARLKSAMARLEGPSPHGFDHSRSTGAADAWCRCGLPYADRPEARA